MKGDGGMIGDDDDDDDAQRTASTSDSGATVLQKMSIRMNGMDHSHDLCLCIEDVIIYYCFCKASERTSQRA